MITARQNELASANETRRIQLQGELATLNAELDQRKINADLQKSNNQYFILRIGLGILLSGVGFYWGARFWARTLGLDDFHVAIKQLDADEIAVSKLVLLFWFGKMAVGR